MNTQLANIVGGIIRECFYGGAKPKITILKNFCNDYTITLKLQKKTKYGEIVKGQALKLIMKTFPDIDAISIRILDKNTLVLTLNINGFRYDYPLEVKKMLKKAISTKLKISDDTQLFPQKKEKRKHASKYSSKSKNPTHQGQATD